MFIKKLLTASVAATLSAAAYADIVTTWDYVVTSEFLPSTVVWGSGTVAGGKSATSDQVQWGPTGGPADLADPANPRSGVKITNNPAADGTVDTLVPPPPAVIPPDNIGLTQIFTHYNNPININFEKLREIDILTTLTLTPNTPAGPAQPQFSTTFKINFLETPNASSPCAGGTPTGVPPNVNVSTGNPSCADIFVLSGNLDAASFVYEGFKYFVSIIELSGALNPLLPGQCLAAGNGDECFGFLTPEGADTPAYFGFLVTAGPLQRVPEPSSIALLGLGLGAAGYLARRRRKAK